MAIDITQTTPRKAHKGQPYETRRMGKAIPLIDRAWSELTPAQRESILHGDGCGHPSNRPKSVAEARRWIYTVRTDKGTIHGFNPGWALTF